MGTRSQGEPGSFSHDSRVCRRASTRREANTRGARPLSLAARTLGADVVALVVNLYRGPRVSGNSARCRTARRRAERVAQLAGQSVCASLRCSDVKAMGGGLAAPLSVLQTS